MVTTILLLVGCNQKEEGLSKDVNHEESTSDVENSYGFLR